MSVAASQIPMSHGPEFEKSTEAIAVTRLKALKEGKSKLEDKPPKVFDDSIMKLHRGVDAPSALATIAAEAGFWLGTSYFVELTLFPTGLKKRPSDEIIEQFESTMTEARARHKVLMACAGKIIAMSNKRG